MADTHIKIKPVTPRVQYTGNGSTTVFPYSFPIFDETEMVVYEGDDVITTGYTVSGAGQTDGGNVTFGTAPADGTKITLLRNVSIERMTDFQEGGTFRPKNINDEFDRQTAFMQQVQEKVDRTLILPPTTDIDPSQILGEVERIYDSIDNVDAVADNKTNVNAVAGDLTNIDAVASDLSNIDAVAGNQSNIDAVAGNATNINAVNSNKTNIDTVATNVGDVETVAGSIANVNTVAGSDANIGTVATNISDVNNCATNMSAIQDAPNQAQAASDSAALSAQYANDKINQTHISNCITYIPQDIKLELDNGTLTIKAGSKVYVPNGADVFDEVVIASDITVSCGTTTGQTMVFYRYDATSWGNMKVSDCYSGTSVPAGTLMFYNTSTNNVDYYTGGTAGGYKFSLPLAIITVSSGTVTSIDQIFNGFGYIGSTIFALPGIKGLIPNGRNTDGSLKSIEFSLNEVRTATFSTNEYSSNVVLTENSFNASVVYDYNEEINYCFRNNTGALYTDRFIVGNVSATSGKITSFTPKSPFHALDYNDKETIIRWGMPDYTAGYSISSGTAPSVPSLAYVNPVWNNNPSELLTPFAMSISDPIFGGGGNYMNCAIFLCDAGTVISFQNAQCTLFPLKGV